jgi:repressor LexA
VLDFIRSFSTEKGYPPSRTDIAKAGGVTANAVQEVLQALARRGAIALTPGIARGIRIL